MTGLIIDPYRLAPTGPTTYAADNFNRADAATLGTSSSGHTWDEHGNAWSIDTNRARPPGGGPFKLATLDAGHADVAVEVTIIPNAGDLGLVARVVDTGNHVLFNLSWDGRWLCKVFYKVGGGGYTGLTSLVDPVPQLSDSTTQFTARLELTGDAGEAFIEGASQGTWTGLDSGLLSATSHGLAGNDAHVVRFDDLAITSP